MEEKSITKQPPREDMMFWRLTGSQNVFFSDGETWKKHSHVVRTMLHQTAPIDIFISIALRLFDVMGNGGTLCWDSLSHRYTLDVVGNAIMGYDFDALTQPNGAIVQQYHHVMKDISHPLYVGFPILERWLPRRTLLNRIHEFRGRFRDLLDMKRKNLGPDFVSFLLDHPEMSEVECLENVITIFMAAHVRCFSVLQHPSAYGKSLGYHGWRSLDNRLLSCSISTVPGPSSGRDPRYSGPS